MSNKKTKVYVGNGHNINHFGHLSEEEAKALTLSRLETQKEIIEGRIARIDEWRVSYWDGTKGAKDETPVDLMAALEESLAAAKVKSTK